MCLSADDPLLPAILRGWETACCYFAERCTVHGTVVFVCPAVPSFTLARIDRVPVAEADTTLAAIVRHFEERGVQPRVRLTPLSAPADWPVRLLRAGFAETAGENYWIVPRDVELVANPAVAVREIATAEEADAFSTIQAVGFDLPPEQQELDRRLARRHVGEKRYHLYLATVDGIPAGAACRVDAENGLSGFFAVATHAAHRRRGVGTALLARIVEDARARGDAPIFFTTDVGSPAESWYARLGFVPLFCGRTFECRR